MAIRRTGLGISVAACVPCHFVSFLPWDRSTCYLNWEGNWGGAGGHRQGHGRWKSEPQRRFPKALGKLEGRLNCKFIHALSRHSLGSLGDSVPKSRPCGSVRAPILSQGHGKGSCLGGGSLNNSFYAWMPETEVNDVALPQATQDLGGTGGQENDDMIEVSS